MTTYAWVEIYTDFVLNSTTYTEEGLHRPVFPHPVDLNDGPPLPDTNYMVRKFQNVTPRKGREFSEMEVPLNYSECSPLIDIMRKTPKCLKIGNIVGWIDSLEPIATKGPSYNTLIRWHIDYYLTGEYIRYEHERWQFAPYPVTTAPLYTLGRGRLKRGPASLARPDPSAPRRWEMDLSTALPIRMGTSGKTRCAVVLFTKAADGLTTLHVATWTIGQQINGINTITMAGLYDGELEEMMNLQTGSIIGAWIGPVLALNPNNAEVKQYTYGSFTHAWYEDNYASSGAEWVYGYSGTFVTTDSEKWVVVDPLGTTYATVPWGIGFIGYKARIDIGTSGAWLHLILMKPGSMAAPQPRGEGREVQIPLPNVPITSNDLSDYVLSGQKDYDRTMAAIQQEQAFKSGVANAGTGAIGGAIAGTMTSPGVGTVIGAGAGLATSILGSYLGGEIQKETDRKSLEAGERLTANQASNVIIPSGGPLWWKLRTGLNDWDWCIAKMVRDADSAAELALEQSELGYITDSQVADCSTIVATGGGIRIEGVEVKGNLLPEGKAYIAALFARGVHLDLIQ